MQPWPISSELDAARKLTQMKVVVVARHLTSATAFTFDVPVEEGKTINRKVGDLGEAVLMGWCAEAGATVNKAYQDERGWDFLLEFPEPALSAGVPLDKLPDAIRCLVQVKSTDGTRRRLSVPLKNWARLVRPLLPTFFLILEFDDRSSAQRAYLAHVGEDEMRRVLQRLRALSAEGVGDLKGKTLDLTWGPENQLPEPAAHVFFDAIRAVVGDDFHAYEGRKNELFTSLGYEEARAEMELSVVVPKEYVDRPEDLLIDFGLGLLPKLEVSGGQVWDTRFGLRDARPELAFETGQLTSPDAGAGRDGVIRIRRVDGYTEIDLHGTLHVPTGLGKLLTPENLKLMLKIPFGHILLKPAAHEATLHFTVPEPKEQCALADLHALASLILFPAKYGRDENGDPVPCELYFDSKRLGLFHMERVAPKSFVEWAIIIDQFWAVAKHLDLHHVTTLRTVEIWQQQHAVNFALMGIKGRPRNATMFFHVNRAIDVPDETACAPQVVHLILGDRRIMLGLAHFGRVNLSEREDGEFELRMRIEETRIEKQTILDRDAEPPSDTSYLDHIYDAYEDEYEVLRWWPPSSP